MIIETKIIITKKKNPAERGLEIELSINEAMALNNQLNSIFKAKPQIVTGGVVTKKCIDDILRQIAKFEV